MPHVRILDTHHCGKYCCEYFNRQWLSQYVLCCCDYVYQMVDRFGNQIQSEYYGENIYVSIEGIAL